VCQFLDHKAKAIVTARQNPQENDARLACMHTVCAVT